MPEKFEKFNRGYIECVRERSFDKVHSNGDSRWIMVLPLVKWIHSPEDLILYKLMYLGLSQQLKHPRDIAAILKAKKKELDLDYIEQWATRLGLRSSNIDDGTSNFKSEIIDVLRIQIST